MINSKKTSKNRTRNKMTNKIKKQKILLQAKMKINNKTQKKKPHKLMTIIATQMTKLSQMKLMMYLYLKNLTMIVSIIRMTKF